MLGHDGIVVVTRDDLQTALQVLGLGDKAGLGVALGIALGRAHIALTVHHLVPLPVDDGPTGHADLEHVGIVGDERDGHKAAERPAVDTQAVCVDVG